MARTVTAKVNLQIDSIISNLVGLATTNGVVSRGLQQVFNSGVGAGQVDWAFTETNTLTASATKDYDLSGVLTDVFGATIAFARVKVIAIFADSGNTNNVVLGGAAATQFIGPFGAATHTVAAQPGGMILLCTPSATAWTLTNAASDLLRVTNSAAGTSVLYDILILGCSA